MPNSPLQERSEHGAGKRDFKDFMAVAVACQPLYKQWLDTATLMHVLTLKKEKKN